MLSDLRLGQDLSPENPDLSSQMRPFIEAEHIPLAAAGGHETVDAGVIGLEKDLGRYAQHVGGPDIDHAPVAEDGDPLSRVGGDDLFQGGDHRGLKLAHIDPVAALGSARRAVAIDPSAPHLYVLADMLVRAGNREEAIAVLERAVELAPEDPRYSGTLLRLRGGR